MNKRIQINVPDGSFSAYVALPEVMPAPAIVVVHEVFGVNSDIRQSCQELAATGYLAICPDLFWRMEPGIELTDRTEAERAKALTLYNAFNLDAGVADAAATIEAARRMPESTGAAGILGYCLGGVVAFLTTARTEADAAVAYYPGNADSHLEEASRVVGPLMVHLAEEDEYISKQAQRKITAALQARPQVQIHSYPGCNHAFARHRGITYDAAAAALAGDRTNRFLERYLKGTGK
jgi:carboxymethylenebutenolidase